MYSPQPTSSLAAATAPLWANFGDALTLVRDGNAVQWCYEGQTVVVAQQADGSAKASFVDAPGVDRVSGGAEAAIYRRSVERCYQLTAAGAAALVADMLAFLGGDREPFFTFVGTRPAAA